MNWLPIIIVFIIGVLVGLGIAFVLRLIQAKTAKELAEELFRETEEKQKANIDAIIDNLKNIFGNLSLEALSKTTEELLKLAREQREADRVAGVKELENKKNLIDQQLARMTTELEKVSQLIKDLEKDREQKFGELASQLKVSMEQSAQLFQITSALREALSSSKARGQWGERMAEDVLRAAGFVENINYQKQKYTEESKQKPDFTFLLPNGLKLNMDVKFPFDNYLKYLEATAEVDKENYRKAFLKDVRNRIKEVVTRDYINPKENTLDYVLLFIPNEQIYSFIHEQDSTILDEALKNKVILCSPITLFAVLAIIRQSVETFALERRASEILILLTEFRKRFAEFVKTLDTLGNNIRKAMETYEELRGNRIRQIQKPLDKIEEIRTQQQLPILEPSPEPPQYLTEGNGSINALDQKDIPF